MSENTPPNPYFNGINFNPGFFSSAVQYLTEAIANTKYLLLSGANFMTGNLGIKRAAGVELDVDGRAYINNNFFSSVPSIGIYGGNSTRLIMAQGTASEFPLAVGVSNTSIWYGSQILGNHIFYTGDTEKLKISPLSISVGSGTNFNFGAAAGNSYLTLSTGTASLLGVANTVFQHSTSAAIGDTVLRAQSGKRLLLQAGQNAAAISVQENANVGIGLGGGTTNSRLHMHNGALAQEVKLQITDATTGTSSTNGCAIIKNAIQEMFITNYQSTKMAFATANITRLTISDAGLVCIGVNTPSQILQVGDGARLRISNGATDYSLIGTKETDDANNTRIVIS
jgi:hypothetical protein